MPILKLCGCPPEPLGNYLKALGVFRLVAEQADPQARAWWQSGVMRMQTRLNQESLSGFFLGAATAASLAVYQPTPIYAPWGGRPGYYRTGSNPEAKARLRRLHTASKGNPRLRVAVSTLAVLQRVLRSHPDWLDAAKAKKAKEAMVSACRNHWPHEAIRWLDACLLAGDVKNFGLLFGTGGNEGSGDITNAFWEFVEACIGLPRPRAESARWLASALFGVPRISGLKRTAGQHFPSIAGGENIGQLFTGSGLTNPWDLVLALEGAVLFAGAQTKKLSQFGKGKAAFPFMLEHVASGLGAESVKDERTQDGSANKAKAEFWMPLWQQPVSLAELSGLLADGRLGVARDRPAQHSVQAMEAVARLGVDAGLCGFRRVALFKRRGDINIAATLEEYPIVRRSSGWLPVLDELGVFRSGAYRRIRDGIGVPDRLLFAKSRLESSVAALLREAQLREPSPDRFQAILSATSALERQASLTKEARELLPPCAALSTSWVGGTEQGWAMDPSAEAGLGRAVASILPWPEAVGDPRQRVVGSLRSNLLPVVGRGGTWAWDDNSRAAVWSGGASLLANLAAVLHRRLLDAQRGQSQGLPLSSAYGADFTDVLALWQGMLDEDRLSDLIHALALVDFGSAASPHQSADDPTPDLAPGGVWFDADDQVRLVHSPDYSGIPPEQVEAAFALPRTYALLKLCFVGGRLPAPPIVKRVAQRTGNEPFPHSPLRILNLLLAGRGSEALETAIRFLRARGCATLLRPERLRDSGQTLRADWLLPPEDCRRLAGLLLIPVRCPGVLAALSLKPKAN